MSVLGVELDRRKHIHFLQLVMNCFFCCWGTSSDSYSWFGRMFLYSLYVINEQCIYVWIPVKGSGTQPGIASLANSQRKIHLFQQQNTHEKTVHLSPFTWILQNAVVYYSRRCFFLSFCLKNIFMLLLDIFHEL